MKVKKNDLMAFVYWAKVDSTTYGGVYCTNVDNGAAFEVCGDSLIQKAFSADWFEKTEKVTKTEAAEKLSTAYNRPFTVCFKKANGDTRELRGRLIKPEPLMGRSMVEDLDLNEGSPMRLVDHRTIEWLIVDGVKYEVK